MPDGGDQQLPLGGVKLCQLCQVARQPALQAGLAQLERFVVVGKAGQLILIKFIEPARAGLTILQTLPHQLGFKGFSSPASRVGSWHNADASRPARRCSRCSALSSWGGVAAAGGISLQADAQHPEPGFAPEGQQVGAGREGGAQIVEPCRLIVLFEVGQQERPQPVAMERRMDGDAHHPGIAACACGFEAGVRQQRLG